MSWTLDSSLPTLDAGSLVATLDGSGGTGSSATIFGWSHSYDSPRKTKFNQQSAKFGDGYEQRTAIGINHIMRTWDLRFIGKSDSVASDIASFLDARSAGQSFLWAPEFINPGDNLIRVVCTEYDIVPGTYNSFDITATFRWVPGE